MGGRFLPKGQHNLIEFKLKLYSITLSLMNALDPEDKRYVFKNVSPQNNYIFIFHQFYRIFQPNYPPPRALWGSSGFFERKILIDFYEAD